MLFGGATLLSTRPALAKKKKQDAPAQATDEATPGEKTEKSEKPAEQAGDTEKPKTILDTSQDAPKTDSLGHIHFGSPNAEGLGRVAVKAAPESKIKIFLEGRYFGTAPLTIYSVPKGDYIVEAVYSNGKQVSRPVTVGENEETAVDLGGAQALRAASGPGMFEAEMTPGRMTVTKVGLVVAAVGAVAAIGCGIMVLKTESDYEKAIGQPAKDDLESTGNRWALFTNLGLGLVGAGLIVAGIAGYPLVLRPSEKTKTALIFTPTTTPTGGAGGALTVRF
jgi:PEGA domain